MKLLSTFCVLLIAGLFFSAQAQTVINNFDNSAADFTTDYVNPSSINISDDNTDFVEGTGSLDVDAVIANIFAWGTYTLIDHANTEDWTSSKGDTLHLWIKVRVAPTVPSNMFFRVQLLDQPTPSDQLETYIYEDSLALDKVTDWYELNIPFNERTAGPNPDNTGFVLAPSGWGLSTNNGKLDFDKIVKYELVAVTGGAIADSLKFSFDNFTRGPMKPLPVELTSFSANVEKNITHLSWQTATEKNNKGFEIQRKQENGSFVKVGFVSGNGTSTQSHSYTFVDSKLSSGSYTYRLKQIDLNGQFQFSKEVNVEVANPHEFALNQNYPNPFNPSTTISYEIPVSGKVVLNVYNTLGVQVASLVNENKAAGNYTVHFNANSLSSGIYFYKLTVDNFVATKKMILLK